MLLISSFLDIEMRQVTANKRHKFNGIFRNTYSYR